MGAKACMWESSSARAAPNITTPIDTAEIWWAQKWFMEVVVERERSAEVGGSWSHSFEQWTVTATLNKQLSKCLRFCPAKPGSCRCGARQVLGHTVPGGGCRNLSTHLCPHSERQLGGKKSKEQKKCCSGAATLWGLQEVGANVSGANSAWRFTTSVAPARPCGCYCMCNSHGHVQTCFLLLNYQSV